MFGKKVNKTAYDSLRRAEALRDAALFRHAQHGPRI